MLSSVSHPLTESATGTSGNTSAISSRLARRITVSAAAMMKLSAPLHVGLQRAPDAPLVDVALVDVAPEVPLARVRVIPEAGEPLVVLAHHHVGQPQPEDRHPAPAAELARHLLARAPWRARSWSRGTCAPRRPARSAARGRTEARASSRSTPRRRACTPSRAAAEKTVCVLVMLVRKTWSGVAWTGEGIAARCTIASGARPSRPRRAPRASGRSRSGRPAGTGSPSPGPEDCSAEGGRSTLSTS